MISRRERDLENDRHDADTSGLTGRRAECRALDLLVSAARTGQSQVLVVHGEAGIGKSALLDYLNEHVPVARYCAWRVHSRIWSWPSPASISSARQC